jgi:3-hydroxybutyryl-CoA dehydratase
MTRPDVGAVGEAELHVTEDVVDSFADLTTDRNRLHLDEDYAARTPFGERVAHGMLSGSVVSAAITDLPGRLLYLEQDLSFERPVYLGETLRATATVAEHAGEENLVLETDAVTDRGRVLSGEALMSALRWD